MFNLTKVSLMVASALYASAVSASVAETTQSTKNSVWIEQPSDYAPKAIQREESTWSGTSNQTVRKQHKVFRDEDNISGIQTYIVELNAAPVSSYEGGISGIPTTRNTVDQTKSSGNIPLNLKQKNVSSYINYLSDNRTNVIAQAKVSQGVDIKVKRTYSVAFNGFSTQMTQEEAKMLSKVSGVKRITREKIYNLNTYGTPTQTGADQVWANNATNASNMGEGTVIGIIDTGINTDHPSFAATGGDGYTHINPLGVDTYLGDCETSPELCNDKLIGVYSYPEITDSFSDPVFDESRPPTGEDYNSHGSHVAGTAAGNVIYDQPHKEVEYVAQSSGSESGLIFPQASGMAPHANIIAYQVCFPGGRGDPYAGCPTSAILAAIEQSAIDNVDVINASLGGLEEDPWSDPIEQAFFHAAQSGVFVAVAAGNSGPELTTADHSGPWVTTVAAHTPSKIVKYADNSVEQMSGGDTQAPADVIGATGSFGTTSGLMVDAANFANPNESRASNVKNCDKPFPEGTFDLADDPATLDIDESTEDVIVMCSRSFSPLIYKADNVAAGGAEGLVVYNRASYQDGSTLPKIPFSIPSSLIKWSDSNDILSWLSSGTGHMGTVTGTEALLEDVDLERVAYFSGRGPSYFGIDTLLVDLAAPGVDIFAPASDDQPFTQNPSTSDWATLSGTSMASPHVAGAAAIISQSHPDWSPMEIQSALLLTATNDLKNARFLNNYADDGWDSSLQDMGSGRMRVDLADRTGLIMHEDIDKMGDENPSLGGHEKRLNTAYMVDTECPIECSFVRTFTATEDATWTLNTEKMLGNFEISVEPQSFSIKEGETQSIVVTSSSQKNASAVNFRDLTGNQGQITMTSDNPNSPILELPVWTYSDESGLPSHILINAHRTSAVTEVGPLNTTDITNFTSRSYGMVKGDKHSAHIFKDKTASDPFDLTEITDEDGNVTTANVNHVDWTEVPEGAKLVSSRVTSEDATDTLMFMGQDLNNDGIATIDEMLCLSTTYDFANFCSIVEPNAGTYWTVFMNVQVIEWGETDKGRTIDFATGVVIGDNGSLEVSGPISNAGYEEFNVDLTYNLPEMEIGDVYFGGFDMASNENDLGNIGFIPVTIAQVNDDVTFTASQTKAKSGDIIDFEINVIANNEKSARDFVLTLDMPSSLKIIEESITPSNATPGDFSLVDNMLTLEGIQPTTKNAPRNYNITTSATDEMCTLAAASSPFPGYLDLREFGWRTLEEVQGAYYNEFEYSLKELMATNQDVSFPFFNKYNFENIKINPAGLVSFGTQGRATPYHVEFPRAATNPPPPPFMIAPLWIGDNTIPERFDSGFNQGHLNAGVTPTYTWDRSWLVLEWDNVERSRTSGQLVDFEMFLRMNINYEPGEYEMLFAYDNLQLVDNQGSIGFKASDGMVLVDGDIPRAVNIGNGFAFNNIDSSIEDKLVVCMDYTGPEESQFNVKFQAYVSESAAAVTHTITLENGLAGSDNEQVFLDIEVTGNIIVADISDKSVNENESISFEVYYSDENSVSNFIEVVGDNFTTDISGNETGSTVTLTPTENFHGDTTVEVFVKDNTNPSDSDSSSFMLQVESDGIELGCTDSAATNFDVNANSDDGSCTFPAPIVEADKKSSGGGAIGWLALTLLPIVTLRRKKLALAK